MQREILIFSENNRCSEFCRAILANDFDIKFVSSVWQLKSIIKESTPDLVVMHSQDGDECIKKLQDIKRTTGVPVFILSDENNHELIIRLWQEGACGYLVHPPKAEEFYSWIAKSLGKVKIVKTQIERAREFIELNFDRPITLGEIADEVGFSAGHLCRAFKEKFGMPPMNFLQTKRLEYAKQLLEDTDLDLPHIIEKVGFRHTHYFCREFKKFAGTSPIEYRQRTRAKV